MAKTYQQISYFRPDLHPSADIPLGARSVGHYILPTGHNEPAVVKHFIEGFWCVSGQGNIEVNGVVRSLKAGQVAILMPGMVHHTWNPDSDWEYHWWTMDGPMALELMKNFGLREGIYSGKADVKEKFTELEKAIQDLSAAGEHIAGSIAYQLLSLIRAEEETSTKTIAPLIKKAILILKEKWSTPGYDIQQLAKELEIHRSTLSRQFSKDIGIPVIEYLLKLRIQHALSLLKETHLSIAEISQKCGYEDANYFSRLITRKTGYSPLAFRKSKFTYRPHHHKKK